MKNTIIMWAMLVLLSFLTACGGSDSSDGSDFVTNDDTTDDVTDDTTDDSVDEVVVDPIDDTASEVVTTLADVNGFNIVTTTLNPRSRDVAGVEVEISAYVKDHSNNPVADGTVVTFIADDHGLVEDQCVTVTGGCSVKWISSQDRSEPGDSNAVNPFSDYIITIMARTIGEDSFIDKNSDSLYDVGETWFTQDEPYLDTDDNGSYDSAVSSFDEFFDYNGNGTFDPASAFTFFRGVSCSDGAIALGHCAGQLEVWDTVQMINSSGQVGSIRVFTGDCSAGSTTEVTTITATAVTKYCLVIRDPNGNIPPAGTKISATTDNGEIIDSPEEVSNKYETPGVGYRKNLEVNTDGATSSGNMNIEVEWLNGEKSSESFTFDD